MSQEWAQSKAEQLLIIEKLEDRIKAIELSKQSVYLPSYSQPTRSEWEAAYLRVGGELPIIPGTRLCWYDMREGFVKTFTTSFDEDNGLSSSGIIYPYTNLTNKSPIRFLGYADFGIGSFANSDGAAGSIYVGANWNKWARSGLFKLRVYFRVYDTALITIYPGLREQFSVASTYYFRVIQGQLTNPNVVTPTSNPQRISSVTDDDIDIASIAGTTATYPIIGCFDIYNPYGIRNEDTQEAEAPASFVYNGWVANLDVAATAHFTFFLCHSTVPTPLVMESEISGFSGNSSYGSRAWLYGYFEKNLNNTQEYGEV